jgi:hypothetical protein
MFEPIALHLQLRLEICFLCGFVCLCVATAMQNDLVAEISSLRKQLSGEQVKHLEAVETQQQSLRWESSNAGVVHNEFIQDKDAIIAGLEERVREAEHGARLYESIQIQDLQMELSVLEQVAHILAQTCVPV